jgi:hypothetical protein
MAEPEKKCPKCQEKVKLLASVCKHCGYEFSESEMEAARKEQANTNKFAAGCAVIVVAVLSLALCGKSNDTTSTSGSPSTVSAADRNQGFHCLSKWDGSSRSLVEQVKLQLRDPNSFEHDETRIAPNKNGQHAITMRYRAKNGFGGMNVATAVGTVDHDTCEATVLTIGD